jgi:hypothetical protein
MKAAGWPSNDRQIDDFVAPADWHLRASIQRSRVSMTLRFCLTGRAANHTSVALRSAGIMRRLGTGA